MCDLGGGFNRCAGHCRAPKEQRLEEYIAAWEGGPAVDPEAAIKAIFAHQAQQRADALAAVGIDLDKNQWPDDAGSQMSPLLPAPPIDSFGPVDPQYGPFATEDTWNIPDTTKDTVTVDGRTFIKAGATAWADWPDGVRIEADRELTNDEIRRMAGVFGYAQRSILRGAEGVTGPYRDGPNSFVMYQDATKTFSDDTGVTYSELEETLPTWMKEGTPVRKTDRSGTGTKGTRLIDGVPDVNISIWYDSVVAS